ncbi:MAG: hypothetical protein JWO16_1280 [Sphingomonas bacterium]|nr:hypothetical protein [Sphingomonas bacterium]
MTDSSDPRQPVPLSPGSPFKRPNPQPAPGNALAATATDDAALAAPEDYDPADYRWVPVRRKPRLDGWTEEKQRHFIEVLADTGLVGVAAKAVGMSRETAYRLRRSPHGAAFARAWDTARHHAGGLVEDIVFERAIEGVEREVYNGAGEVVGARLVHDNRLLKYLLSHLNPDRYGAARGGDAHPGGAVVDATPTPAPTLDESLRAMEPALPAPPEQLLTPDELEDALEIADIADGKLPRMLSEQRPPKSDYQLAAEEHAARMARGEAALAKRDAGHELTQEEFADENYCLDPIGNMQRRRRSR